MREKQPQATKKSIQYGLLNDMSTETLKSLIQQDCFGSEEDQLDDDTIEMIIDIISQREPEESDVDIDALWNTFVTEYMPTVASSNLAALSSEPDVIRILVIEKAFAHFPAHFGCNPPLPAAWKLCSICIGRESIRVYCPLDGRYFPI